MIAPQQRVRHEIGPYGDAAEAGDVARFRKVVGEPVPRHVGRQRSRPGRQQRQRREGQPRGFDPGRSVSGRQPATSPQEARERAQPPEPRENDRAQDRGERAGRQDAGLPEQQHEQPDRDTAGREGRRETALLGLDAGEKARHEVSGHEGRRHENRRHAKGRRVARCGRHRRREQEPGPRPPAAGGGAARAAKSRSAKSAPAAAIASRGRRVQSHELVAIGPQQGQRPPQQHDDRDDDEAGARARPGARGPGPL